MKTNWAGVYPALTTQFRADHSLDLEATAKHLDLLIRSVARASGLPILVYNNPPAYYVDVTAEMFAELADEPTLVAIKESSDNVRRITDLINLVGDRYILFSGVDDLVLESVLLGVSGWRARQRLSGREPATLEPGDQRPIPRSAGGVSLVHPIAAPGYP